MLCKEEGETILHFFQQCAFIKAVWIEFPKTLGVPCFWEGPSLLQAWEKWRMRDDQDVMVALPLLVLWGVWLVRITLYLVINIVLLQ